MYVIGEFVDREAAASAIRMISSTGVNAADLDVFSEEPVELPRGLLHRPSRMSLASVIGAAVFGILATAFVYWTQYNYPLVTGGMPVFSFWATGVISFEMTMLGGIIAVFAWFLWESGLCRRRDRSAPVPRVNPGSICLRVRCRMDETAQLADRMHRAGAIDIERKGAT